MNYIKLYDSIILNARNQNRTVYTEKHHVIPKCLGGSDDKDNIVDLTAKEHYVCHHLLAKQYKNNKNLWYAFIMMTVCAGKHQRDFLTARMFEKSRELRTIYCTGKLNPMYGKIGGFSGGKHTEEAKEKVRPISK